MIIASDELGRLRISAESHYKVLFIVELIGRKAFNSPNVPTRCLVFDSEVALEIGHGISHDIEKGMTMVGLNSAIYKRDEIKSLFLANLEKLIG